MTAERVASNPHMADMPAGSTHWRCKFTHSSRRLTVRFSMGPALTGEPIASAVLDCLASDAAGVANAQGFEEWASEYGYDSDSRTAEKIYRTIEGQARRLEGFLGSELYARLLWQTERE